MLSAVQLSSIFPQADGSTISAFVATGVKALQSAGILDGVNRLAYFLAQLGHESNGLTVREENLNYSASRLMQVWPSRFPTLDVAKKYEYQPEKLANFVYGDRLGNVDAGDGYNMLRDGLFRPAAAAAGWGPDTGSSVYYMFATAASVGGGFALQPTLSLIRGEAVTLERAWDAAGRAGKVGYGYEVTNNACSVVKIGCN